jgi:hypothetical protein
VTGVAQGLAEAAVTAVFEDRDRNLWLGSENRGLMRVAAGGFVSYDEADGLANDRIASVFDAGGDLWVLTSSALLHRFDGERFVNVSPPDLARARHPSWGSHQLAVRDGAGVVAAHLRRSCHAAGADLPHARPKAVYSKGRTPGDDVHRVWLDQAGGPWVSSSRRVRWSTGSRASSASPSCRK